MNKKILTLVAAVVFALGMSAQTTYSASTTTETETTTSSDKYKVETNHFWDNWFLTAGGGVQVLIGDYDKYLPVGDRISPALDISVGKWFSPSLGVQLSYSGLKLKGLYNGVKTAHFWTNDVVNAADLTDKFSDRFGKNAKAWEQEASYFNFHIDGLLNLSNLFCGYSESRVWNVIPYIGVGLMRTYSHNGNRGNSVSFNGGLINRFRLSPALDLNLTIKGNVLDDDFDGEVSSPNVNNDFDGVAGVTLGLTYKFKERGWNRSTSTTTYITDNTEIDRLNSELNALRADYNKLKSQGQTYSNSKSEVITFPYMVNFVKNKVDVVNRELVNLKTVADMIKATPGKKYNVVGYADKQTGSVDRNIWLAENRAKNVYDVLVNEFGVNPNSLKVDSKGGVDYMFYNDPQLSRSVIISEAK